MGDYREVINCAGISSLNATLTSGEIGRMAILERVAIYTTMAKTVVPSLSDEKIYAHIDKAETQLCLLSQDKQKNTVAIKEFGKNCGFIWYEGYKVTQ